jgi:hypothetical protein
LLFKIFKVIEFSYCLGTNEKGCNMKKRYWKTVSLCAVLFSGILIVSCAAGNDGEASGDDAGPPVLIHEDQDSNVDECVDRVAEETFRFSLCTCRDATSMGVLETGSFDSLIDKYWLVDYEVDDFGAAIGVNRNLYVPGVLSVGGSALLSGPDGVELPGLATVQGDFKIDGTVEFEGVLNVARDLVIGENFVNFGYANIGRDIHLGGAMSIPLLTVPKGQIIKEKSDVSPPCACGADEILDIEGIVADARTDNQDDIISINPDWLTAIVGYMNLDLPPGRYYFSDIVGAGKLTLKVTGHTALFVDGDMLLAGDLDIELGDNATLDIFIAGDFKLAGANNFDSVRRPSALRFYVGGTNDVTLTGYTAFVGNLYAPNANVILTGASFIYGSIFAGDFLAMGDTAIYFDRDINRGGDDCGPPDVVDTDIDTDPVVSCESFDGACVTDSDCCEPLVCDEGQCKELDWPAVE